MTIYSSHAWNIQFDQVIWYAGGHTAEMLRIVNVLQKDRFAPRFYIAAATDNMSLQKAKVLEESLVRQEVLFELHLT